MNVFKKHFYLRRRNYYYTNVVSRWSVYGSGTGSLYGSWSISGDGSLYGSSSKCYSDSLYFSSLSKPVYFDNKEYCAYYTDAPVSWCCDESRTWSESGCELNK